MDSRDPITSDTFHCFTVCLQILHSHSTQCSWAAWALLFINSEQSPELHARPSGDRTEHVSWYVPLKEDCVVSR